MASRVETIRALHEEIEQCVRSAIDELSLDVIKKKDQIERNHIAIARIQYIVQHLIQLRRLYDDTDHSIRNDLVLIHSGEQACSKFLQELDVIVQHYNAHPELDQTYNPPSDTNEIAFKHILQLETLFSREERLGAYLDLSTFHSQFINLRLIISLSSAPQHTIPTTPLPSSTNQPNSQAANPTDSPQFPAHIIEYMHDELQLASRLTYVEYLQRFDDISWLVPLYVKQNTLDLALLTEYDQYLERLKAYLLEYLWKCNPLLRQDTFLDEIKEEFETLHAKKAIVGWNVWDNVINHRQDKEYGVLAANVSAVNDFAVTPPVSLNHADAHTNNDSSESHQVSKTPTQPILSCPACNKNFDKEQFLQTHLDSKAHKKVMKQLERSSTAASTTKKAAIPSSTQSTEQTQNQPPQEKSKLLRDICFNEFIIGLLGDLHRDIVTDTIKRAKRRLTQTRSEILMENQLEDDEFQLQTTTQHTKTTINLSDVENKLLTPDGRVIPAWLYKLHGFNIEYPCDLCQESFRGERDFRTHFYQPSHVSALKCLGVTMAEQYVGITKKQDVIFLHDRLTRGAARESSHVEQSEDLLGNIFQKNIISASEKQY